MIIVEGEKCVHACLDAWPTTLAVTTWAGGTNAWRQTDWTPLAGREVSLVADADPLNKQGFSPGHKVMEEVAAHLHGLGCKVRIALPPVEWHSDVADWIADQGSTEAAKIIKGMLTDYEPPPIALKEFNIRKTGLTLEDFTATWDDDVDQSPLPALLRRNDKGTVLYASKLNWIFGLPSSGKTWLSLIALNEAIMCGGRALVFDFEDSKQTFQRRTALLGLDPRQHTDHLRYTLPGIMEDENESILDEAQEWLMKADNPVYSQVVIDAAESSGCPSDGVNVNPWIGKMLKPWRDVDAGVCVVDHQPKRKEDRPLGPIGSQRKLAAVDGCALETSGLCWTKKASGKIIISSHKDRAGDLDSAVGKPLAVVVGTWKGEGDARAFSYTIEKPEQQEDVESLSMQILDAVGDAGDDGISSLNKLRQQVKGKNSDKDATIDRLKNMGYILQRKQGQANIYTVSDKGRQWRAGLE